MPSDLPSVSRGRDEAGKSAPESELDSGYALCFPARAKRGKPVKSAQAKPQFCFPCFDFQYQNPIFPLITIFHFKDIISFFFYCSFPTRFNFPRVTKTA